MTDPATGEVTAQVAMAGADEVDAAVAAAKEAYATWRTSSLAQRIAILFRYRELLNARRDDLAALITAEQGKVHADALGEVARGLEIVELACGLGMALKGDTSTEVSSNVDVASIRQPLGVIVGISPFNFPAMISMWMFTMAIACGNTFVHKPASKAPSASMLLAELAAEAGGARRCAQHRAWRRGRGERPPGPPGRGGRLVRRAPRRSPATSTPGRPPRASASRPSARRRTTCWCCPTPISTRRPRPP